MNKRDFMVRGGGSMLAGASWMPLAAQAKVSTASRDEAARPARHQDLWQALQGQSFGTHTALGRPLTLVLSQVRTAVGPHACSSLEQFTVSWQGPRSLPLPAGLHTLHHPETGAVAMHLEPVSHGEAITYDAHFSLLA